MTSGPVLVVYTNLHLGAAYCVLRGMAGSGAVRLRCGRLADMGEASPERETGAKYLVIGPGQKVEDTTGYVVVNSPTYNVNFGTRALDPDPAKNQELLGKIKIYPLSQRGNPKSGRLIPAGDKTWSRCHRAASIIGSACIRSSKSSRLRRANHAVRQTECPEKRLLGKKTDST